MAFPCICYKCARLITLESLKDPECLSIEEKNCYGKSCRDCDFICERFTDKMDFKKRGALYSFKI
ncbi:MAG: hypothetical protein K6T65_11935 [Peptococcaceae bacterium]|nr:hypothetical protein [Peptococcaceae bacterium]